MKQSRLDRLRDPDIKYRAIPFWSWNGELDPEELRAQVRDMAASGFGGYFVHARAGLKTPYFGEDWMRCIEACVDEGDRRGVRTWLYDENGYPSGFAGGAVPALGPDYVQKHLHFEILPARDLVPGETTIALYRPGQDYTRADLPEIPGDETVLHAFYKPNPYYADLLDRKVVRAFIDSTYEPYYERFGRFFGGSIRGIFTDEPQYGRLALPWSFALPEAFRQRWGYEILDCLPALFAEVADYRKKRCDFWSVVTNLFTEGCARQLAQWCTEHGCELTGHVLLEEDTRYQTMCSGSAMEFYSHMHIPGIDWLGKQTGNPVIVKQLASVAAQTGRELALSEMFAAGGWNTTLAELRQIAQWQYVLGVNLTCAHLYPYTLYGVRKNDHPPAISFQTGWWSEMRTFNDAFARIGQLLSEGSEGERLLVIHPLRSGWAALDHSCYEKGPNAGLRRIDGSFEQLSLLLTGLHYDYHYADEGMLRKSGEARDRTLRLGLCEYRTVILPVCTTLEPETAELLLRFARQGGRLFACEGFPELAGGLPSPELAELRPYARPLRLDAGFLSEALGPACRPVSVCENGREAPEIYHRVSRYPDGAAVYLVNMGAGSHDVSVRVPGYTGAGLFSPEDCTFTPAGLDGEGALRLHFEPGVSYVVWFDGEVRARAVPDAAPHILPLSSEWDVTPLSPNILVLDTARLSAEGGPWSPPRPLPVLQRELLELCRDTDYALKYTALCADPLFDDRDACLAVEEPRRLRIEVNGKPVSSGTARRWKDRAFGLLPLHGLLRPGENTVVLRGRFYNSPAQQAKLLRAKEFEAEMNMLTLESEVQGICILGGFVLTGRGGAEPAGGGAMFLRGPFSMTRQCALRCAEMTSAGYPFFTGTARFEQSLEIGDPAGARVLFSMQTPLCAFAKLTVNGASVRTLRFPPYEAEISPFLRPGRNTLTLELTGTDRNLFGPHHHPAGEPPAVGPFSFLDIQGPIDRYCTVPFGPGGEARLIFKK